MRKRAPAVLWSVIDPISVTDYRRAYSAGWRADRRCWSCRSSGPSVSSAVRRTARTSVTLFSIEREVIILDLAELPETPSIFYEVPNSMEYDPRQNLIFLNEIADEISRPIARDDRVHVEYVPTQVVTEFIRTAATSNGKRIDGIAYRSSRHTGKSSMVLFADQANLVLPESLQDSAYKYNRDHWIRLNDKQDCEITNLRYDYDAGPVWGRSGSAAQD